MLQDILENKSSTKAVGATIAVGLAEGVIHGEHRGVFSLGDRHLDGAASIETSVEVQAVLIENAAEQAAFIGVTSTEEEHLSPAEFEAADILVFGEGVGDEVRCEGHAHFFCEMPVVRGSDAQLGGQFKLVGTLDDRVLE